MSPVQIKNIFPLNRPLIHCISNEITAESLANALLFVGARPIMSYDPREVVQVNRACQASFINLGQLNSTKEAGIRQAAADLADRQAPWVLDIVGIASSQLRQNLVQDLLAFKPTIIKGNLSEMRYLSHLPSLAKGIDRHPADSGSQALRELSQALAQLAQDADLPCLVATGQNDLVIGPTWAYRLDNGVPAMDNFVGSGDLVGALMAACLSQPSISVAQAAMTALSYFNICGQMAADQSQGLENFRQQLLNNLSLVYQSDHWCHALKGASIYETKI